MTTPEMIQALVGIVTAAVAVGGFALTIKRLRLNNERSKGELAVNLLCEWSNYIDHPMSSCIRLADKIDLDTIHEIWSDGHELCLPQLTYEYVVDILSSTYRAEELPGKTAEDSFTINSQHVGYIGFQWTKYFNRLEATLSAWQQGYADQPMMEKQFRKLLHLKWTSLSRLLSHPDDAACFPVTREYLRKLAEEESELKRKQEDLQRQFDEIAPRVN